MIGVPAGAVPAGIAPAGESADPQASLALHVHAILAHSRMLAHGRAGRLTVTTCPLGQGPGPARATQIDGATLSHEHLSENTHSPDMDDGLVVGLVVWRRARAGDLCGPGGQAQGGTPGQWSMGSFQ